MGHLLKIKFVNSRVNMHILASTSVSFTLTTVQVPYLALTRMKRITVYVYSIVDSNTFAMGIGATLYARVDLNPYASVDFILQSGTMNLASD